RDARLCALPPDPRRAPRPGRPEPPPRRAAAPPPLPPRRRRHWGWWLLPPVLAALAVAGWLWWQPAARAPAAAQPQAPAATVTAVTAVTERSIAVLPLANASPDADQQFFSDGLSDNLIDALSRFDGLKVIGRMSSFRFRD